MSTQPTTFLTPEQYLEIERKAETRSEYYNGEMFAVAGASERHGVIIYNIAGEFRRQFKGRPCRAIMNDLRVRVLPSCLYTYPDVVVMCGESQYADDRKDTVQNPVVLVEVLSESTRDYDRGRKFEFYRGLTSLREYLVVAQDSPHVELWTRQDENHWLLTELKDGNQSVHLTSIDCVLKLSEIYDQVDWSA
jgi:Uma2 family endonuclease